MNNNNDNNNKFPWRCGANFVPSTAINQLEMWQAESFDLPTIKRELGWAAGIGMRMMRVFLHDLLWVQDPKGFCERIEQYLECSEGLGIKTSFVFFDDCWGDNPQLGQQPAPRPGIHNSGWMQSPGPIVGDAPSQWARLEDYVGNLLTQFGKDERVCLWDLYNEPGNGNTGELVVPPSWRANRSLPLLQSVFRWARLAAPEQPITVGLWMYNEEFADLNAWSLAESDVVSFHCYAPVAGLEALIEKMKVSAQGRPLVCSEYMARTTGSTFADCLPVLKKNNISAINWGLVNGKSQTIYPWGWRATKGVPEVWHHDVFQPDGKLLYPDEGQVFASL